MKMFRMAAIALLLAPALALAQGGAGNGTTNRPASNTAVQVGGQDPTFKLQALKVDADGALLISQSTGSGNTGVNSGQVQGNVASGMVDSGNPVKLGGVYNASAPSFSSGQRGDLQLSGNGALLVANYSGSIIAVDGLSNTLRIPVDSIANSVGQRSFGHIFNGSTWDRQRGDTTGTYMVATPTPAAANAIAPIAGSLVNALVGKASPGNLYGVEITTAATAGYLYVFNATAAPADGAVVAGTASGNYQHCQAVAASSTVPRSWEIPDRYSVGIVAVFSTTACGTLTKNATPVFLKVRAQ